MAGEEGSFPLGSEEFALLSLVRGKKDVFDFGFERVLPGVGGEVSVVVLVVVEGSGAVVWESMMEAVGVELVDVVVVVSGSGRAGGGETLLRG